MPHAVYLRLSANGRGAFAHVPDLPGCCLRGLSRQDVLNGLPSEIAGYLHWLERHGEPLPASGWATAFEVASEAAAASPLQSCHQTGLFPADLLPLADKDVARFLRLMRFSRDDLLALLNGLEYGVLIQKPAGGGWPIRSLLRHLAGLERWYLDRLGLWQDLPRAHSDFEYMAMTRAYAYDALGTLTPRQRSARIIDGGEAWTARKVFRRFLEHEREHTCQVTGILARLDMIRP
jgi:predicted RNase H-like HicB family nuclease